MHIYRIMWVSTHNTEEDELSSDSSVAALVLCTPSRFHIEQFYISVPVFS